MPHIQHVWPLFSSVLLPKLRRNQPKKLHFSNHKRKRSELLNRKAFVKPLIMTNVQLLVSCPTKLGFLFQLCNFVVNKRGGMLA